MYDIVELNNKLVSELKDIAKELNIPKFEALKKQELVYKILDHQAMSGAKDSSKDSGDKPKRGRKPKTEETPALFNEETKVDSRFVDLGSEETKTEDKTKLPDPD